MRDKKSRNLPGNPPDRHRARRDNPQGSFVSALEVLLCGPCASVVKHLGHLPRGGRLVSAAPNKANLCGRGPRLRIWDWGFEDGESGPAVWTECQTNPIWPGFGQARANSKSEARNAKQTRNPNAPIGVAGGVSAAPNKPNFGGFGLQMRVARGNKANPGGRGGRHRRLGIGDSGTREASIM
jgi:hypothetical protein